jgi:hypothetical protein
MKLIDWLVYRRRSSPYLENGGMQVAVPALEKALGILA